MGAPTQLALWRDFWCPFRGARWVWRIFRGHSSVSEETGASLGESQKYSPFVDPPQAAALLVMNAPVIS